MNKGVNIFDYTGNIYSFFKSSCVYGICTNLKCVVSGGFRALIGSERFDSSLDIAKG